MDEPVFLTGGTGYFGSYLRQRLADEGVSVTLLVRPETTVEPRPNESVVRGDVTNGIEVGDAKTVVHLAAQTSVERAIEEPARTWAVNATGTVNVLEAARTADVDRFFFVSTASVYGPPESLPIGESHPLNAVEPYGASKLAADRMVRAYHRSYDIDTVTVRPFNTFGPRQPAHNLVPTVITQALAGGPVELGNLDPARDFLYVVDLVDALEVALERGESGGVYNVGSGEATTVREVARTVIDHVDPGIELASTAERERDEGVEIERHLAETTAITELGWSPDYDLEAGIEETIAGFRS